MSGLRGLGGPRPRMPRTRKVVRAKAPTLADVEFRLGQEAVFIYEGKVRSGTVRRIDQDSVLITDDSHRGLRRFLDAKVEGRPLHNGEEV